MAITRIAVIRENVVANADNPETKLPVFAVATEGRPIRYGMGVVLLGPSTFKFDPAGNPQLGNRVWVETTGEVIVTETPNSTGSGLMMFSDCGRC
jgi:hypothetical protein